MFSVSSELSSESRTDILYLDSALHICLLAAHRNILDSYDRFQEGTWVKTKQNNIKQKTKMNQKKKKSQTNCSLALESHRGDSGSIKNKDLRSIVVNR